MKYVMAQPAVPRFEWEVKVAVYSLLKLKIPEDDIVVLFSKHHLSVVDEIKKLGVSVHVYDDERYDFEYIPSLKPYLMYRYLEEDASRENETYFFMDSDVIVKEEPSANIEEYTRYDQRIWYGSNCNGYLNYDYIIQCKDGQKLLEEMVYIVGVSVDEIKLINSQNIGAQYIMTKPSKEYFHKVYIDSIKLWKYIKNKDTNLQKWTVEMWATLWNMIFFEIMPRISDDLEFAWATDSRLDWYENKIYHNAGVTEDMKDMFFKGDYINKDPFNEDFSHIDKGTASYEYTKLITEARDWLNESIK